MTEICITVFIGGLLGSAHCLGMCGGFAATLGACELPFWPVFSRQFTYGLGRVFTYAFLGALGGSLGTYLSQFEGSLVTAQQIFSGIAGVVMLLVGLSVLGVLRFKWAAPSGLTELLAPIFRKCLNARNLPGFFGAGMANGFLPCGLVYAFLAMAVSRASMVDGMLIMTAFGLGTIPAMVAIGCGARLIGHTARLHIFRIAACFVIVLGVVTIARAMPSAVEDCCSDHPTVEQVSE